jgi:hypothetical protein
LSAHAEVLTMVDVMIVRATARRSGVMRVYIRLDRVEIVVRRCGDALVGAPHGVQRTVVPLRDHGYEVPQDRMVLLAESAG